MRYSTANHNPRQPGSVNSRLDFDAAKAAATFTASQAQTAQAHGATAARGAVGAKKDTLATATPRYGYQGQGAEGVVSDATRHPPPFETGLPSSIPQKTETSIRADIELARIALGLCLSALFRLWLICHQIIRDTNNPGVTRLQLDTALQRYGVQGCPAYITRLLHTGAGRFWRIDARGTIFPVGYITLCKRLVQLAADSGLPHLYDHQPGTRKPMYIDISGSMKDFEAHIVAAWYECHNNPTVSRFLLQRWFNRSDVTLRKLERRARVEKTYNTAETLEPSAIPLDAKGELRFHRRRTNKRGQTVYSFQLPNSYKVTGVRQHPYRGQGRKALAMIRELLAIQVTGECEARSADSAPGDDNRGRLYYADYKRVRQARRKGRDGVVYSPARPGGVRHTVWDVWV